MKKEFNLSEKINHSRFSGDNGTDWIYREDVKEFIKRLKKAVKLNIGFNAIVEDNLIGDIDKLAGKSLVESNK